MRLARTWRDEEFFLSLGKECSAVRVGLGRAWSGGVEWVGNERGCLGFAGIEVRAGRTGTRSAHADEGMAPERGWGACVGWSPPWRYPVRACRAYVLAGPACN